MSSFEQRPLLGWKTRHALDEEEKGNEGYAGSYPRLDKSTNSPEHAASKARKRGKTINKGVSLHTFSPALMSSRQV